MSKDSPKAKRHARTRQAILDAAQEIIVEQGPDGLSMRELANRIEYSPSGLYEYFGSKEEIINEVCMQGFANLSASISHISTRISASERLIAAATTYLEFAMNHPEQYRLMFGQVFQEPLTVEDIASDSAYSQLKQIIRDGIEANEFRHSEQFGIEEMTYGAWAQVHGLAMLHLTLFRKAGPEIDRLNRRAIEGFTASLRTS